MLTITHAMWSGGAEALSDELAIYAQQLEDHKGTVGVPAPMPAQAWFDRALKEQWVLEGPPGVPDETATRIDPRDFMDRLDQPAQLALYRAARTWDQPGLLPDGAEADAETMRDFMAMVLHTRLPSGPVNLLNPETAGLVQWWHSLGLLTAVQRDALLALPSGT